MATLRTLLLRLQGPMQSWGTTSRFDERDTQLEPSKSGVLGLICAALGRDRSAPVDDLAALKMGVRVDNEGALLSDYHTAQNIVSADGRSTDRVSVGRRYYLSDAVFLVGLEGERALLEQVHAALRNPFWPLALGRKSFAPSMPVYLHDGLVDSPLEEALRERPSLLEEHFGLKSHFEHLPRATSRRLLLEVGSEGAKREGALVRLDQPLGPFAERRFGPRFIHVKTLLSVELEPPCILADSF